MHDGECHCDLCGPDFEQQLKEMERREQESLRAEGWYAHLIVGDYHTHGLPMSFDHPDIQVVLPIDPGVIHRVVRRLVERISVGEKFLPGTPVAGIVKDMNVLFVPAMEGEHHAVLRMILPEASGNLERDKMTPEYAAQYAGT